MNELDLDAEVVDFLQRMQARFPREHVQIAMITGIAAEECVVRGYSDEAIATLTETLLQVIEHERQRQAAGSN